MTSLAQVTDVRQSPSDTGTSPVARIWRNMQDPQLLTLLTRATRKVEGIVGTRLASFSTSESVWFSPSSNVAYPAVLPGTSWWGSTPPLAWSGFVGNTPPRMEEDWTGSLTEITALDPNTNLPVTIDVSAAQFDASSGRVVLGGSSLTANTTMRVTYTGGYSTVPDDLIEATIYTAADSWIAGVEAPRDMPDPQELWARINTLLAPWTAAAKPLGIG